MAYCMSYKSAIGVEELVRPQTSQAGPMARMDPTATVGPAKPRVGVVSATFLIFNRIIGTGVFATPGVIMQLTGSAGLSMLLWLAGTLIAMSGAAVYLEFGTAIP
ncbi:hypothetical protein KEM52_005348 [Ascosphaera acerosa]|nr:hypothetical protein KEM52_005348 [Ascosphaera acerosa]